MTPLPVVTTSERTAFRRGPQKWWWSFRMGLRPRHEDAGALWFGIGVHEALAQWYGKGLRRSRIRPADYFADWVGDEIAYVRTAVQEEEYDLAKYEDAGELGTAMLDGYVKEYGKDPDWKVIAVESPFAIKVKDGDREIAIFKSTFDLVFMDLSSGEIYLGEHKTASQISTPYLSLDDQGGIYWAVARHVLRAKGMLPEDQDIAGIQYNFLRKAMPDERPRNEGGAYLNKDGSVSKKQPPPLFVRPDAIERHPVEQRIQFQRLSEEVTAMNLMREGKLKPWKNTGKDCTWCPFFRMCQLHERGGDSWKQIAAASFVKQDPYDRYNTAKSAA